MIRYQFTINKFPKKITGPSSLSGFIESDYFSIFVDNVEIFKEQEFLVYELFDALHNWFVANQDGKSDFYFASMDYEEEPVVAFSYDHASGNYRFDSAFKLADATFKFDDIADSYQQFKSDLKDQLQKKFKFSLDLDSIEK